MTPLLELKGLAASERTGASSAWSVPRDLPDIARFLMSLGGGDTDAVVLLDGIDVTIAEPGVTAVVGAEGAGKSSLVRVLARELVPTRGVVLLDGVDVFGASRKQRATIRRTLQVILDDALAGLDDRMTLRAAFAGFCSALKLPRDDGDSTHASANAMAGAPQGSETARPRVRAALAAVGLDDGVLARECADLSAGEAKRAALARALLAEPRVVVMDEPTRNLDPFERSALVDVVMRVFSPDRERALVVATRDIAFARAVASHVVVLEQGVVVEQGARDDVLLRPTHARTIALLAAEPNVARAIRARSSTT